ncbi:hypothetical protein NITGR_430017 [Nitrospina gracilis 3/211]|uniref:Uncharacterized protein n=1 Tax=Nitrospina gracilis (strain 3/211) TaxID=1266370 RepID=M1YZD0_NITG3|nr:hypothetical protein NITGR_430017 [Nitrospina gracilis 3/211]
MQCTTMQCFLFLYDSPQLIS